MFKIQSKIIIELKNIYIRVFDQLYFFKFDLNNQFTISIIIISDEFG